MQRLDGGGRSLLDGISHREDRGNVVLIPVAAGVLYPINGVLLSPVFAAGAMALSSVFVLGNALRLKGWRPAS